MRRFLAILLFVAVALPVAPQATESNLRLELQRAELNEAQALASLEQIKRLHAQGIESEFVLKKAQAEYDRAVLETKRARLALANELPSLRVVSAIKSRQPGGQTMVTLRLQEMERVYDADLVRRYLVSIKDQQSIISQPYEQPLTLRGANTAVVELRYRLLKDVDDVVVLVNSGTKREEIPILLEREMSANQLQMMSPNYSQEGALGDKVEYTIQIERFSSAARDVQLGLTGLPAGFAHEWIDAESKAKLSRISFADHQNTIRLLLRVFLPEASNPEWFGRLMPFRAEALSADGTTPLGTLDLQLRPIGLPRLALSSDNLLLQVAPGAQRRVLLDVTNVGAADARGISFESELPMGFRGEFDPPVLTSVAQREKKQVALTLIATPEAVTGEYNLRVKAISAARMANVESPELTFRIEVGTGRSALWIAAIIGLVLAAMAFLIVRMTRRVAR
ncbi:MAG TPA: NEW3 domain-containing protein [Thermoanaerobaculia bacterium]|jgi:uncharacterized membrane protein|nr:NEW3 domain-containing protein [Thermoanaerobaculia bacterium]